MAEPFDALFSLSTNSMNFLWSILIGAALGILSGFLTKRRDPGFFVVRAIIGIICGAIAGVVGVTIAPTTDSRLWISLASVIVLLFIYWLLIDKRKTT